MTPKQRFTCLVSLVLLVSVGSIGYAQTPRPGQYAVHPDSLQKLGVPEGTILQGTWKNSKIYPGTVRDYWIYIPKQYDGSKPAALMVFQDGGGYVKRNGGTNVPNVFDNLIDRGEMPYAPPVKPPKPQL